MLLDDNRGFCPWCKQGTAFTKVHEVHYATPKYGGTYSYSVELESPLRTGVLIYTCLHCSKSVVLLETELKPVEDVLPEGKVWRAMVSPQAPPRALDEAAPTGVKSLFTEASKCEAADALRGAGVLYRAAVEELVRERGGSGKDLYSKIDSLKEELPAELIADLHEARLLGNDSIHAGITYSADEVADVAGLIEEAVLVLYVQPEQKRAMREARKGRRDAAKVPLAEQ